MADLAISENFGDLLDPRFSKIYQNEIEAKMKKDYIPDLFGMETASRSFYKVSGMGAMQDVGEFTGQLDYDTFDQLYDKTFSFPERALGFKVSRKLYDDDEFGVMDRRPKELATSVFRTRQKSAASFFNNAFTATSGNPDSVALCSASHPYSPNDSTTMSNAGSTAMSAVAIEATRIIGLTSILNDRGELADVNYDTILVPPALEETAYEVINSSGKVDTANNNVNIHKGKYKLIVWNRLTDANNWFMIDSDLCKMYFLWIDRVKPEFNHDRDFDTLSSKWSVYMRYDVGHSDFRPIYGHNVS